MGPRGARPFWTQQGELRMERQMWESPYPLLPIHRLHRVEWRFSPRRHRYGQYLREFEKLNIKRKLHTKFTSFAISLWEVELLGLYPEEKIVQHSRKTRPHLQVNPAKYWYLEVAQVWNGQVSTDHPSETGSITLPVHTEFLTRTVVSVFSFGILENHSLESDEPLKGKNTQKIKAGKRILRTVTNGLKGKEAWFTQEKGNYKKSTQCLLL